jgi:uncharacterized protein (DUF2147 family)
MKIRRNSMRNALFSLAGVIAALTSPIFVSSAMAADPSGTWLRESGASRVKIAKCGSAYCGTIVWLKDPSSPAKVGQRVFYEMEANGDGKWAGKAFNPEDGKTYSGKMVLAGNQLTTSGCALGGLVCKSVRWSRAE